MTIDIREGDLFIPDGQTREYPVRRADSWETNRMNSIAFRRMARKTASIKRDPGVVDKLSSGAPETIMTGLRYIALDPASLETQKSVATDAPIKLLETIVADKDGFVHIVVEDIQPTIF
jgi:hypothetical protein